MESSARITLTLIGRFHVRAANGSDVTPRGRKSCALLAMLALSAQLGRSRSALRDTLWSDRSIEQGASSLRQTLAEIRKALGGDRDCIVSERRFISLAAHRVNIDVANIDRSVLQRFGNGDMPVLLADLDLPDRVFMHWLRAQRQDFAETITDLARKLDVNLPVRASVRSESTAVFTRALRPWVRVLPATMLGGDGGNGGALVAHALARHLVERDDVTVCSEPLETPGIDVAVETLQLGDSVVYDIKILSGPEKRLLWSGAQHLPAMNATTFQSPGFQLLVTQTVDIALAQLRNLLAHNDESFAFSLCYDAIQKMFALGCDELAEADRLLERAFEIEPSGIFLAWRAYSRTFVAGEYNWGDAQNIADDAKELASRAMELAPFNPVVLALSAYVHSFLLRDYRVGHALAERSLELNALNPLGRAILGRTKSYMGQHDEGYRWTSSARSVAGPSPYRYTIDFLCGITAAVAGHHEEAIEIGEVARVLKPEYRANLRSLLALYISVGDVAKARSIFTQIKQMEPDFSLDMMRAKHYPNTGMRDARLLSFQGSELQ